MLRETQLDPERSATWSTAPAEDRSTAPRTVRVPTPATPVAAPLLTVVVPCFNSEAYLSRAVDPLLGTAEHVEVVLVDDGSTDATAVMIDRYAAEHPERVRAVHQANGGHGAAMTTGIAHARGEYLKVLDSDDWFDPEAFAAYLHRLREWVDAGTTPDALITNYVYENVSRGTRKVVRYASSMPEGVVCGWGQLRRPRAGSYFLMHALTYRTAVLRDSGVEFPRHTFYVDNLMASIPLRAVRTLAYLDVDLYRYFIGREDQSVAETVMISRLDQQLRVNRLLVDGLRSEELEDAAQLGYLLHYASIVTSVSLTLSLLAGTEEAERGAAELRAHLRETDPAAHRAFRRSATGRLLCLPGRTGDAVVRVSYRLARRRFGFN